MFVRTTQYTFFCHYLKCWLICTRVAVFGKFLLWSRCLYQYVCTYHIVYNFLPLSKMLDRLYYGSRIREIFAVVFAILWIFSLYQLFSILTFGLECLCVPFLSGFPNSEENGYENSLAISNSYWSKLTVHTEAALKISLYVCIWCKNNTLKISHSNS